MKEIQLTKGKVAFVDDEDYEYLSQFKWAADKGKITYYARAEINGVRVRMHRIIMNATNEQEIDHKDRDGLNNQKENLRFATSSQNALNKTGFGKSKFRGVHLEKRKNRNPRWVAAMKLNKKNKRIGRFKSEIEAAMAYNYMAHFHHGEFANLNILPIT